MFTESILVSSLAALALAEAAANPEAARVTQAPVVRRQFGEAGDIIDGAISNGLDVVSSWVLGDGDGDDVSAEACASAIGEIDDFPQPTGELASALETSGTNLCEDAENLDGTLQEDWEAYRSSASEWYAQNSEAVSSAVDACPSEFDDLVTSLDCITGESSGGGGGDGDDAEDAAIKVTGLAMTAAGAAVGIIAVML